MCTPPTSSRRAAAKASSILLEKKDLPKLPKSVSALHFGSISLIPEPCGSTYETLQKRSAKNSVVSLDPNIRASLIKDKRKHLARLSRMIALCDIVKISDEDIVWMTGSRDFAKMAKSFLRKGAKIVAVTKGGEGCLVFSKSFGFELAAPKVVVADTVGAGDTFTAGFLTHLHRTGHLSKKAIAAMTEAEAREAAAFAMKTPGELSAPVKSASRW